MDLGVDVSAVSTVSQGLSSTLVLIGTIAFLGFIGRLVFVAYGQRLAAFNPLRDFSGAGLIGAALAIFVAGLFITGKQNKALILLQRNFVDPFIVTVLGRDSCEPGGADYCVVVFEEGREISVNWHDQRVNMFEVVTPSVGGVVWHSLRPLPRPAAVAEETALLDGPGGL